MPDFSEVTAGARAFNLDHLEDCEYNRKLIARQVLEASSAVPRDEYERVLARSNTHFEAWIEANHRADAAEAELERLREEGSPGVMHKIDKAFYELTVKERDYERARVDRLTQEIADLRARLPEEARRYVA